ncbi:hypothetical protein FPOAC2_11290 [Fusarium poae]|uniref:Zn(2)-C6 fungal-type domain-containing protein n=2 Tax=Fusarium poae TaxID=36050 RepID=A0A1B8ADA9_FUSPO|nr:hypothetical protein FPOA_10196 [Fusarium poae]
MVGVPRSTGCQLCRTRKVKCDGLRPACSNCSKYGTACPGYDRNIKFVNNNTGKHLIRQRGRKSGTVESSSARSSSSIAASDEIENTYAANSSTWSLVKTSPTLLKPGLPRGPLLINMVEVSSSYSQSTDVFTLLSWLNLDRLGKRAVLDGAVCSFALHLAGKASSNTALVAQSRTMYGLALSELQAALRHSTEWKTSETLCAAILLCYFELFAGTSSSETWLQHAKGIGTLMEQRGPAAHAEGWDAAMLLSFRGVLIIGDFFYPGEEELFLSRPEWNQVMFDGGRRLIYNADTPIGHIHVGDGFLANLTQLSPVIHWGYLVREANRAGISVEPSKVSALAQMALVSHARFVRWYEEFDALEFPRPIETLPTDPTASLFKTVLEHQSAAAGSLLMGYWASMLIIEETLIECGTPRANADVSSRYFVEQILRSIESVAQGAMGPYRIGFAVRIVYEFSTGEEQRWIGSLLDKFSKGYAAVDKRTYPKPKDDIVGSVGGVF